MLLASDSPLRRTLRRLAGNPSVIIGGALVLVICLTAIFAPYLGTRDPNALSTANRLKEPGYQGEMKVYTDEGRVKIPVPFHLGSDNLGRDV